MPFFNAFKTKMRCKNVKKNTENKKAKTFYIYGPNPMNPLDPPLFSFLLNQLSFSPVLLHIWQRGNKREHFFCGQLHQSSEGSTTAPVVL